MLIKICLTSVCTAHVPVDICKKLFAFLQASNGVTKEQIIKFELNEANKVEHIDVHIKERVMLPGVSL